MYALLNITMVAVLGIATASITWRLGKALERNYDVYVVRNDGKVVLWDGGSDSE